MSQQFARENKSSSRITYRKKLLVRNIQRELPSIGKQREVSTEVRLGFG